MKIINKLSVSMMTIAAMAFGVSSVGAKVSIINDDFSSGSINTIHPGTFGSVGLGRSQRSGTWALRGGSLTNTGVNEHGLSYIVDVSSLAIDNTHNTLNLSFDYTSGNASDSLFVHIYGYQNGGGTLSSDSPMIKVDATKGNAWTNKVDRDRPLKDDFIITNFVNGSAQGMTRPYRGDASGAIELAGTVGPQSFDKDFSLSLVESGGPAHLDDYDYIVLVFTRRVESASSDISIDNLNLSVESSKSDDYVDIPEFSTYALFFGLVGFSFVVLRRRLV